MELPKYFSRSALNSPTAKLIRDQREECLIWFGLVQEGENQFPLKSNLLGSTPTSCTQENTVWFHQSREFSMPICFIQKTAPELPSLLWSPAHCPLWKRSVQALPCSFHPPHLRVRMGLLWKIMKHHFLFPTLVAKASSQKSPRKYCLWAISENDSTKIWLIERIKKEKKENEIKFCNEKALGCKALSYLWNPTRTCKYVINGPTGTPLQTCVWGGAICISRLEMHFTTQPSSGVFSRWMFSNVSGKKEASNQIKISSRK